MSPDKNLNDHDEASSARKAHDDDAALQDEIAQFDALINQHLPDSTTPTVYGEVMEVPVVSIHEDNVLIDVGGKSEAYVNLDEFPMVGGKRVVEVGQLIKVVQITSGGESRFSHREARSRDAERKIQEAKDTNTALVGRVSRVVKGGLMVDIGLDAFMPASQVDLFRIPDLASLVGQNIEAYVLEYDPRRKRAVLSRRRLLFERRESTRKSMLDSLVEGQTIKGKVKSALDFGVFVDLGVIDGFVPREEVSYDRGTHPSEIVKSGDDIELKVIKVDRDGGKITLSRRRMSTDPWEGAGDRHPVGSSAEGTIIAIQNYGAFVHLEEGVTGMIHASDLSWNAGQNKPSDFFKVGDKVVCKVLEVNKDARRISLGYKQTQADPWSQVENRYPRGTKVKGTITSMTPYGAFVKLEDNVEGMIHVSDITWNERINHPKDKLQAGQEVEAIVLKVTPDQHRISLGLKQLEQSPFDRFVDEHPVGSTVTGKVTRFAPFGAFVELATGLEGLIHISQIDLKRVELPEKALEAGQEVTCKVIKVEKRGRKISLSRRDVLKNAERDAVRNYMKKNNESPSGMTFGEALAQARKNTDEE